MVAIGLCGSMGGSGGERKKGLTRDSSSRGRGQTTDSPAAAHPAPRTRVAGTAGCSTHRMLPRLAKLTKHLGPCRAAPAPAMRRCASSEPISTLLTGTGDPVAEKMTEDAKDILLASLRAADPRVGISHAVSLSEDGAVLTVSGSSYTLKDYDEVLVVGAGKASAQMAAAVCEILRGRVTGGHVVTKYEHSEGAETGPVTVTEASHPVPDEAGLEGGRRVLELARGAVSAGRPLCGSVLPCTTIPCPPTPRATCIAMRLGGWAATACSPGSGCWRARVHGGVVMTCM
jgi:hypothetical protein